MKKRNGFVSNSSSSSFICITIDDKVVYGDDEEPSFETDCLTINIDEMIKKLQEAKKNGAKNLVIEFGGGYDG